MEDVKIFGKDVMMGLDRAKGAHDMMWHQTVGFTVRHAIKRWGALTMV